MMKVRLVTFLVTIWTAVGSGGLLQAQEVICAQRLEEAYARFDIGNLQSIPVMLQPCLDRNGFTNEEKIRAYKLLTLVYLYQDDQVNADKWMIRLLKKDKEHALDPQVDPLEIVFYREKFRYKPIFRVSVAAGGNNSIYREITRYDVGTVSAAYTPMLHFNGYLQLERDVYKGIDLGVGAGVVLRSFSGVEQLLFPSETGTQNKDGNKISFTENQSWLELPLFAKYTYYRDSKKKIHPYVLAGVSMALLMKAKQPIDRINGSENSIAINIPVPDLVEDMRRKELNYFVFGGLGLKIRQKTNFIFFEVRYTYGLINIVNEAGRYPLAISQTNNKQELIFNIGSVDDNFAIDGLMGLIGFQYSIYSPKKFKNK